MNLVVDIGNTAVKAAAFDGEELVRMVSSEELIAKSAEWERVIVCSTRGEKQTAEFEAEVRRRARYCMSFGPGTPVPIRNLYDSPQTLGADRLAAAVGAWSMFPGRTMLVADFGTAITFDIVGVGADGTGEYLGGNISPGARSRFRALHEFTGALPMGELKVESGKLKVESGGLGVCGFPARDTRNAIGNGVVQGIVAETEWYIAAVREKWSGAGVIFTGGDADYFAKRVNFPIFAVSELVLRGLNAILEYNANS